MEFRQNERVLILGGSRGLGAALLTQLRELSVEAISISRKSETKADFSKAETWDLIIAQIRELNPDRIIYAAAGGTYGPFQRYQWKDHQWALRVSFEFPAFLIHTLLRETLPSLKQFIVIGSSIAESKPDPGAAAYSAAKHALRGLITSLQAENPEFDLRLLSPGYMVTDLLPANSPPRMDGRAQDPNKVARLMIQSISSPALRLQNQTFD